jgi:hypothetical protein
VSAPLDTEVQGLSRDRVGKTRRRALAAFAGFGVLAAVPFTMGAVGDGTGLARGARVVPTKDTPAVVKTALHSSGPVVVAFLLPGITEDEIVQKRLNTLERSSGFRDTKFIVYRITGKTKLGDLPEMFDIKYTPAVAVIQGDDKLSNVWRGMVDEDIIAQSLIDARNAVPQPLKVTPRKGQPSGNAAGIALARKVNASYARAPGVSLKFKGAIGGVVGAQGTGQIRLVNGRESKFSFTAQVAGKALAVFGNPTGVYTKAAGAVCWTRSTNPKAIASLGDKAIPLRGVRFDKPVKAKNGTTLTLVGKDMLGQYGGGKITYTIDAKSSQVTSVSQGANSSTYATLATAPKFAEPDKIC